MNTVPFKSALYLCMLSTLTLVSSCDLLFPDGGEENPANSCRISKIDTPWDEDTQYTYDNQGRVVKLQKGISLVEEVESGTMYLSYHDNNKVKEAWDDHEQKIVYEYRGDTLVKTKHYYANLLQFVREYVRNPYGSIKEVLIYDNTPKLVRRYTYSYDLRGNIAQARKYWTFNDSLTLVSTEIYSDYDYNKNVEPGYFLPGTLKMKNNPGKITRTSHLNGGSTSVDFLTYQYNAKGYPLSLLYKHNNEPAWTFTYHYSDCQ